MAYPDFPFKENLPSFVHHSDMLAYLESFARHYGLYQYIQFSTVVKKVEPIPLPPPPPGQGEEQSGVAGDSVRWKVTVKNLESGQDQETMFDAVIVCNGHYSETYTPTIPGLDNFPGRVLHSHSYRRAEEFSGQRVLVVGTGLSGIDIMRNIAPFASKVFIVYHRKPSKTTLPNNAKQFPPVDRIEGDGTVHFENGASRVSDSIILCTGYEYSFPFLCPETGIQVEAIKRVTPLFKHTFNILHPSMAFIGLTRYNLPFPCFDIQARCILAIYGGYTHLPPQDLMLRETEEDFAERLKKGFPPRHAHVTGMIHNQFDYFRELADLGGIEPLAGIYEFVFSKMMESILSDTRNYRKYNYMIEEDNGEIKFSKVLGSNQKLE